MADPVYPGLKIEKQTPIDTTYPISNTKVLSVSSSFSVKGWLSNKEIQLQFIITFSDILKMYKLLINKLVIDLIIKLHMILSF